MNKEIFPRFALAGMKPYRSWYSIKAQAQAAEIVIYDAIGWFGVSAEEFIRELGAIEAPLIKVRLNTPGGDVFDGTAIANALKAHPATVETHIDGLAASIGSIIALAGDTVHMATDAFFMIHSPWAMVMGDAGELRKEAGVLDKIAGTLAGTYSRKTGMSIDEAKELMEAETWYTAEEAQAIGFVDEVTDGQGVKAAFALSGFNKAPESVIQRFNGPRDGATSIREWERLLQREAGLSRSQARAFLAQGYNGLSIKPGADDQAEALASIRALTTLVTN